jgi:hypothetical protein
MKVALNPAELRLIVDALDDKHQFQLQSGAGEGGVGIKKLGPAAGAVSSCSVIVTAGRSSWSLGL